jgi:PAS domain S-box-containing protein
MARALEKREHVTGDLVEIERFDGTGRRVIINMGAPVVDRNGALTGAVVVQTDITDRVRAEAIVRERERQLRQVLDAMYAFVAVLDDRGTLLEVNQSPLKVAGLARADVIGRPFWDCPWWTHETGVRERLRAAFARAAAGEVVRYDETARVAGDRLIVVDFMLQPVMEDGRLRFVIPSGVDVTERRRAEERLREADRRKDEFLATLSHELRNPLSPIRNAARLLGSPQLTPEALAWGRQVIERQVRHMGRLLDDLLDVSRITEGKLELKYERVALNTVVDAAVEAAQPLLDAKRHALRVRLPQQVVEVECDPVRLAQVFGNLLTNAGKYTAPGGQIDFSMWVEGGCVVASVRDDGIGIPGPQLRSVFEMFSQVKGSLQHSEGGLGVGLALARGLVDLHGGSIEARSDGPGRGSEFVVRLPFASLGQPAEPAREPPAPAASGRRIMVADDNDDAAQSLAMLLRSAGHEVVVANDGAEAVDLAARARPDLAILDIGMPRLDGYEVAAKLRQMPWGRDIGLVALTGWGQEHDKRRAAEAGFDVHVTKPLDPDALERLVETRPRSGTVPA